MQPIHRHALPPTHHESRECLVAAEPRLDRATAALTDAFERPPTARDVSLATHTPIAARKKPWDIATMGSTSAFRRGAVAWQEHRTLPSVAWAGLGLGAWIVASHGGALVSAPMAVVIAALDTSAPTQRSEEGIRVDMIARALHGLIATARTVCMDARTIVANDDDVQHTNAALETANEALSAVEARVAAEPRSKVRCSRMLRHEGRLAKRAIAAAMSALDSERKGRRAHPAPRERTWDRMDFMPSWKALRRA